MVIQKSKHYVGQYSYDYLKRLGFNLFFRANNEFIAVKGNGYEEQQIMPTVLICTETKVPLWKQAMQLQCTGHYETSHSNCIPYRTELLSEPQKQYYRFEVYEIIR